MSDETNTPDEAVSDAPVTVDEHLLARVIDAVRPSLQADGGDVTLVGVDEQGVVSVELSGACAGCPMSQMTLSMGIERVLKEHVPGVTRVQALA
jgi:Fe-S cluster biogenesis protein NfuA